MAGRWEPTLRVDETATGCRLMLVGVTHGNGQTLQDAADDLVTRLLNLAIGIQSGVRFPAELGPPDHRILGYLRELGEIARRGGDIRERVFAASP